jgi:hypothetical protein
MVLSWLGCGLAASTEKGVLYFPRAFAKAIVGESVGTLISKTKELS